MAKPNRTLPLRMQAARPLSSAKNLRRLLWTRAFQKSDIWLRSLQVGLPLGALQFVYRAPGLSSTGQSGVFFLALDLCVTTLAALLACAASDVAFHLHRLQSQQN